MNQFQYNRKMRRRKAFLAVVGAFLLVLALPMWMKIYVSQAQAPKEYEQRVVQPGDTLWKYAKEKCSRTMDVRKYVWEIRELNGLDNTVIRPGQVLLLPMEEE